jgi:hypothetical protein
MIMMDDDAERQIQEEWLVIFDNLDKADGIKDGNIERKAMIKWVAALDLQKKIEFEAHLNVSPRQLDRIMAKVGKKTPAGNQVLV